MKQCPECSTENNATTKFCGECGTKLPNDQPKAANFSPSIGNDALVSGDISMIGKQETVHAQSYVVHNYQDSKVAPHGECVLKVIADLSCKVYVDGEYHCDAEEGKVTKLPLRQGEYLLKFVSIENSEDIHSCEYTINKLEALYNVPLKEKCYERLSKLYDNASPWALDSEELSQAVAYYQRRAKEGYAVAQCNLGWCLLSGRGVIKDEAEGLKWYRKAAEQGHSTSQLRLGSKYYFGWNGLSQDYTEAAKWYHKAAEQGNDIAQWDLGRCYYRGQGVSQDYTEAAKWFRKAAEQGNDAAQNWLGGCYRDGRGVSQDYAESVKWFRKAAEQGYVNAQFNLGVRYHKGQGVSQDSAEAVKWFRKAAEKEHKDAQNWLGGCYRDGEGVSQDYAEAVKWYRKAAEQGQTDAQFNLGNCYRLGDGVPQDYTEAQKWFEKAAKQGHQDAKDFIEGVLINGVRWATRNVDAPGTFARNREDAGMYYRWNRRKGHIDGKYNDWDNMNPGGTTWEKINDPSPKGWRIPTADELRALCDTTKVKIQTGTLNGVNVRIFTDIASGKYIVLPAAGSLPINSGKGIEGRYWSNTRYNSETSFAISLQLNNKSKYYSNDKTEVCRAYRSKGYSIRCVLE